MLLSHATNNRNNETQFDNVYESLLWLHIFELCYTFSCALLHLALSSTFLINFDHVFNIFYQGNPLHYCFGWESGPTKKALKIPFGMLGLVFPPHLHTSRCNSDKTDRWIISTCILFMYFFILICFLVNWLILLCF